MQNIQRLLVVILLFVFSTATSQLKKENYKSNTVFKIPKWEVLDIILTTNQKVASPYKTNFYAVFTHSNGTVQQVPGFYNGNKEWVIRFSSSLEGKWNFTTQGDVKKINNKKGSVVVSSAVVNNHGGLVIQQNDPQNFYYEDGTPYFLLAFECDWLYALDYHDKKGLPKTEHLLNLLNQNGFNQVVMNVFSYDVSWTKDPKLEQHPEHEFGGPKDIFPFLGNNDNPNYSASKSQNF